MKALDFLFILLALFRTISSFTSEIDVAGLTVSEVKGFGRQKGQTELYRGTEYKADFLPKTKIELAVSDDQVEKATNAISSVANTGKIGDGKLFVFDLEKKKLTIDLDQVENKLKINNLFVFYLLTICLIKCYCYYIKTIK